MMRHHVSERVDKSGQYNRHSHTQIILRDHLSYATSFRWQVQTRSYTPKAKRLAK